MSVILPEEINLSVQYSEHWKIFRRAYEEGDFQGQAQQEF